MVRYSIDIRLIAQENESSKALQQVIGLANKASEPLILWTNMHLQGVDREI